MRHTPASVQYSTPYGGRLNLLPFDYKVSTKPIGNEELHGYLAYVSEDVRKKIEATGFGEIELHLEYIAKRVGQLKKLKYKEPMKQTSMVF
jgi:hypothetical protein